MLWLVKKNFVKNGCNCTHLLSSSLFEFFSSFLFKCSCVFVVIVVVWWFLFVVVVVAAAAAVVVAVVCF